MINQPIDSDLLQPREAGNRSRATYLLGAGAAVHLVSWFLPVYDEWPGYRAYAFCFSWVVKLILDPKEASPLTVLGSIGPHSNYLVVFAIVLVLRKSSVSTLGKVMWFLLGSFLCNLCWVFDKDSVSHLRIGYFLWLLSFLLIGTAVGLAWKTSRA